MKELKKIRKENHASAWVMGIMLGVTEDYYRKLEQMKDENVPPAILSRIESLIEELPNNIKDYYNEAEAFYESNNLREVFEKANQSVEDISNATLISPIVIENAIEDGGLFPTQDVKDKLIDYAMYINNMNESKNEQCDDCEECSDECEECSDECECNFEAPVIDTDDLINQMPVIPDDTVSNSKESEIAALNRQLDWYEQIIDTFTKLANLVSK